MARITIGNVDIKGHPSKKVRFMLATDLSEVEDLYNETGPDMLKDVYGNITITDLWCKSYMSLILEDDEELVAAIFLNNFPNIPSIPIADWESWMNNIYNLNVLTPRNCLWVHLFVFEKCYRNDAITIFFQFLFRSYQSLLYIVFVLIPCTEYFYFLTEYGTVVNPPGTFYDSIKVQRLLIIRRQDFVAKYKIRRGVIEDNDDVVKLIDNFCQEMKSKYGEYYVANIITDENSKRQVIVAENNGEVVAAMILNGEINLNLINQCFRLETFNGLRKEDPRDKMPSTKLDFYEHDLASKDDGNKTRESCNSSHEDISTSFFSSLEDEYNLSLGSADNESGPSVASSNRKESVSELSEGLSSYELEFSCSVELESEKNVEECVFVGHLEFDISCVALSYTEQQIAMFMKYKKKEYVPDNDFRQVKVSQYYGEANAFAIEVIAANPFHEYAINLLHLASYECFPGRDYSVLSLPCTNKVPPLLKKFFRANPRPLVRFEHELYICHRLSVLGDIGVRQAQPSDTKFVLEILGGISKTSKVYEMFTKSMRDNVTTLRSFVFLCNGAPIGFAIVEEEYDVEYLNVHYYCTDLNIDPHLVDHGAIKCFIVLPIFQRESPFFMQELHRLSDYTKLFFGLKNDNNASYKLIPTILSDMIPITPYNMGEYKSANEYYWELPEAIVKCKSPFALFLSTPSRCAMSRSEVNSRIVVVGASDVGLAFIISLLFKYTNSQVHYSNITIVSTHGICKGMRSSKGTMMMPERSHLDGIKLELYALSAYVNVVEGVMTEINRREKTIRVKNTAIHYDYLILTCGLQYQMPERSAHLRCGRTENPANVFVINTEVDANIAIKRLNDIMSNHKGGKYFIIVYGHSLEAFCCLSTLISIGIPGSSLIYVDSLVSSRVKTGHTSIFNDCNVEDGLMIKMQELGIQIHQGVLTNWEFDQHEMIKSITFEDQNKQVILDCIAIFSYAEKIVSQTTFYAINKAGLVYDGALVIRPDFRTNDPYIFAAGSFTKYPRRYNASRKRHIFYNQEEIGERFARIFSETIIGIRVEQKLDPVIECSRCSIPIFTEPPFVYACLPGGIYYFSVRNPGPMTPLEVTAEKGQFLQTGNFMNLAVKGYFRLHINKYSIIDDISCLSLDEIEIKKNNLSNIWGKHERMFNNLVNRYELLSISDFFTYFQDDVFYAIYNPMFKDLMYEINLVLTSISDNGECLLDDILNYYEKKGFRQFSAHDFCHLKNLSKGSGYEMKTTEMLMDFLKNYRIYLPMYAHPVTIQLLLAGHHRAEFTSSESKGTVFANSSNNILTDSS